MARLRHANGATVEVPAEKVKHLLRSDFVAVEDAPTVKKATPRKAAAARKSKTD